MTGGAPTTPAAPVLPDVLQPDLTVLFCGSAAGRVSAQIGAYYAGPGNRFWPTLHRIGLTPHRLAPHEFPSLPRYGLGLTDLCKSASGADSEIPAGADDPARLRRKIARFRPRIVAFVGKRPARATLGRVPGYGEIVERIGDSRVFVLPSPSGLARRYWDETPWFALAALAKSLGRDGVA